MEMKTNGITSYNRYSFLKMAYVHILDVFKFKDDLLYKEEDKEQSDYLKMELIDCKRLKFYKWGQIKL